MYNKNTNDLHTENYSSQEALKNIRKLEPKKERRVSLSRQFPIIPVMAKDIYLFLGPVFFPNN